MTIDEAIQDAIEEAKESEEKYAYIQHGEVEDKHIEAFCEKYGYDITGSGYGGGARDFSLEYEDEDGETHNIGILYEGLPNFK